MRSSETWWIACNGSQNLEPCKPYFPFWQARKWIGLKKKMWGGGGGDHFQVSMAFIARAWNQTCWKGFCACKKCKGCMREREGPTPPSPLLSNHAHSTSFSIAYHAGRSWYISGKLATYPSPKPTLTLTSHLGQNVGVGEG